MTACLRSCAICSRDHYDSLDGFEPVSFVASITSVFVVNPHQPITNVAEFVAFAKSRQGSVDYASGGVGSQQHVAMAVFGDATGVSMNTSHFAARRKQQWKL